MSRVWQGTLGPPGACPADAGLSQHPGCRWRMGWVSQDKRRGADLGAMGQRGRRRDWQQTLWDEGNRGTSGWRARGRRGEGRCHRQRLPWAVRGWAASTERHQHPPADNRDTLEDASSRLRGPTG